MAKRISVVSDIVEGILRRHPEARDDDFLLYAFVLNHYGHSKRTLFHGVRWQMLQKATGNV